MADTCSVWTGTGFQSLHHCQGGRVNKQTPFGEGGKGAPFLGLESTVVKVLAAHAAKPA